MERSQAFDPVRMLAWDVLRRIERSSEFADFALDRSFSRNRDLTPLDRAFISEMVLGTLRWRERLDAFIRHASKSPGKKLNPGLLDLLRLGAYQVLFMDRVPESAAVNESVRLAKEIFRSDTISGFANALLRSISRNKNEDIFPSFEEKPADHIEQALSHPRWLAERWIAEWGPKTARKVCAANNRKPPFTVRANTLKVSRETLLEQFTAAGIPSLPTEFSPEGLILEKAPPLAEESLFRRGFYFVQDEASQVIPHLLGARPGERVLDACAAPGGKTTHLAQIMKDEGEIAALDLHGSKVRLIRENCARLGISRVTALEADSSRPLPFPEEEAFDRVLVDAPCSGLGILHRNPEAKWRRQPGDILRLRRLQDAILGNVSSWLKRGGVLVYSTCTMTREENDEAIDSFLRGHADFSLEDLTGTAPVSIHPLIDRKGFLRTYPDMITRDEDYRMDGFFAARLRKD